MRNRNCAKCEEPAAMMCQRCFEPYCSVECQVTDWRDHKLICVEMPPLISVEQLGEMASKAKHHASSVKSLNRSHIKSSSEDGVDNVIELPNKWRTIMTPTASSYFKALVQYVEDVKDGGVGTKLWLIESKLDKESIYLLELLQRQVRFNSPINVKLLAIGGLVVANCQERPYRGEILAVQANTQQATLKLIDRGNTITISFSSIYPASAILAGLPAQAFGAIIAHKYDEPIERYSILKIRLVDVKPTPDGFYQIEVCGPKSLVPNIMTQHADGKLLKVFKGDSNFVLFRHSSRAKEYEQQYRQLQELSVEGDTKARAVGDKVAACVESIWYRALLLGHALSDNVHLVYLVDEGRVCFCHNLADMGSLATELPPRVAILQLTQSLPSNTFDAMPLVLMLPEQKPVLDCLLKVADVEINAHLVPANKFFDEAKYGYWREKPQNDSIVRITSYFTHAEIYVNGGDLTILSKILNELGARCGVSPDERIPKKNDIAVAQYSTGKFMRGIVKSVEVDRVQLIDVDTGVMRMVARCKLRQVKSILCAVPSQLARIKLDILRDIPNVPSESCGIKLLSECIDRKSQFQLVFDEVNEGVANLISCNKERSSLNKKMLPLLFQTDEPALPKDLSHMIITDTMNTEVEPRSLSPLPPPVVQKTITKSLATPKPLSTPSLSQSAVAASDDNKGNVKESVTGVENKIKIEPLPEGEGVELFVIDSSSYDHKILTVAAFDKGKIVQTFARLLELTTNFIKNATPEQKEFKPRVKDVFLAVFKDDGEWYRARCLEVLNDGNYKVEFVDYGNCTVVSSKDILGPLSDDLSYPQFTHNCVLSGDFDAVELQKKFDERPIITGNVAKIDNKYIVTPTQ